MANEFSTRKSNPASKKFNLVRLQVAREVGASLVLDSGTTYTHTFHVNEVEKVVVDGTTYTEVSSSPSSTQYIFDESTKLLTINLGAAYSAQQVVVFYFLFYTKDESRIAPETPTDSSSADRIWSPRILNPPKTTVDFKNITDGKLQFGSSALRLHNQDHDFEQYLTDEDSFANKEVTIWTALDDAEHVQISYKGKISRLTVSEEVIIDFDDNLALLDQTFFSNGSYLSSTFNSSKFSTMDRSKENEPIRKLYSEVTTYSVVEQDVTKLLYKLSSSKMLEAVCTDFDDEITTSNNREWGTILSEGDNGDQTDTVQAVSNPSGTDYTLVTYSSGKKFRIGDTLLIDGTHRVQVWNVEASGDASNTFRCTYNASIATSQSISRKGVSAVVIRQNDTDYYPLYDRDYSLSVGTNDAILITFGNNFEATLSMSILDPNADKVKFRAWADTGKSVQHGDVIEDVLSTLNFDVNAASITAANGTSLDTNFYIPYINDPVFPTFGNVIESILRSTLGYLTINTDLEIEYALLNTPSPGATDTRDDNDILKETSEINIDYSFLYNSITPINSHDIIELDYTNVGFESNKATYLHEVKRNREFNHVLTSPDRTQQVINLISERKIQYIYKIKSKDLDSIVGDDYELSGISLPGDASSKDVTILEIEKQPEETIIISSDLLGL